MNVLFVCTGNSARSQIAEGLARHHALYKAVESAGTDPKGLNPLAVQAMAEIGIDISRHTSKCLTQQMLDRADLIVTLCGDALDNCPVLPPGKLHAHWGFSDPAAVTGTEEQKLAAFRAARDAIRAKLLREAHKAP